MECCWAMHGRAKHRSCARRVQAEVQPRPPVKLRLSIALRGDQFLPTSCKASRQGKKLEQRKLPGPLRVQPINPVSYNAPCFLVSIEGYQTPLLSMGLTASSTVSRAPHMAAHRFS